MPTLTAGNTFSATLVVGQTLTLNTVHNTSGRLRFVPANTEAPLLDSGTGLSFGPLAIGKIFGPWNQAGTVTLTCDTGTVTYTVGDSGFNGVTIGGSLTANPVNSNVSIAPSGTGTVTLGATGTGTTTITRVNTLTVLLTDSSGTPGNATHYNLSGRAAFAAAASTVVITNSLVTAASKVFVSLGGSDATLTSVRVTPAAGSFTVTGNAAATATTVFDYLVVN